jgi:hypothetical protein
VIEVKRLIGTQSSSILLDALEAAKIVDDGIGIER